MRTEPLLVTAEPLASAIGNRGRTRVASPRRAPRRGADVEKVRPAGRSAQRATLVRAAAVAVAALWFGCGETQPAAVSTPVAAPVERQFVGSAMTSPAPELAPPTRSYGRFYVTMYHVANEAEVDGPVPTARARTRSDADDVAAATTADQTDDLGGQDPDPSDEDDADDLPESIVEEATLAAIAPPIAAKDASLPAYDRNCEPLALVSRAFRRELTMQGTGKLRDGRMLNVAARCKCRPCFHVLPPHQRWGMGGSGLPLEPFRSVAVDPARIKLGSLLYIPALDGLRMPGREPVGGFVHDGCVVAADTGGNIRGAQLDLFVARRAYLNGLARRGGSHAWMKSLEVFDGSDRCQRDGGKVSQTTMASI